MLMTVAPGMLLTLGAAGYNVLMAVCCFAMPVYFARFIIPLCLGFLFGALASFYAGLLLYGFLTVAYEWRQIDAPGWKKIAYVFTFPLFMATYIPISLCALVRRVEWRPIYHTTGSRQRRAAQ